MEVEIKNQSDLADMEAEAEEIKSVLLDEDRNLQELRGALFNLDKEISES